MTSRRPGLGTTFLLAVVAGAAGMLLFAALTRQPGVPSASRQLTSEVWVSEQLTEKRIAELGREGVRTVIDLRPDGEAPDQLPSADVERLARANGLGFSYVPVQHGDIPPATVDALAESLKAARKPVLLYCRTGKRAARTWALAEASRPGGLDAAAIDRALKTVGQPVEDLDGEIDARIAARATP